MAGHDSKMHGDARPCDALHERHGGGGVNIERWNRSWPMMVNMPLGVRWPAMPVEIAERATSPW